MTTVLNYTPGQTVTVFQEVKDVNGVRVDDSYVPVVTRIIMPDFTLDDGYPQAMTRYDVGLYYLQFAIPNGAVAVGSYLVDITYLNPVNGFLNTDTYQIVVTAPFGNFGVTIGGS